MVGWFCLKLYKTQWDQLWTRTGAVINLAALYLWVTLGHIYIYMNVYGCWPMYNWYEWVVYILQWYDQCVECVQVIWMKCIWCKWCDRCVIFELHEENVDYDTWRKTCDYCPWEMMIITYMIRSSWAIWQIVKRDM